jgi:enoyl-CoA hydratase/carnithine racemase
MGLPTLTTVLFDQADHVATITLNRPDRLNAFTETMVAEFGEIWKHVRDDDDIHCVILRAAGERAFSTGIDIKEGPWWSKVSMFHQEDPGAILGPKTQRVWKPVIAAVHGIAAGGAFYWLNEADIIICSEDATFFDPHASGGIVSALEPIGLLQRGVPLGDVMRWALTGNDERIVAQTALRLGIVTEIVPRNDLWGHAHSLALEIAARRPLAIQGTVRAVWESMDLTPTIAKRMGLAYPQLGNRGSSEGPQHTAERPKPRFR